MATKRSPNRIKLGFNYTGDLNTPIYTKEATHEFCDSEFERKLALLFEAHKVKPGDWRSLTFMLALWHVRGFQVEVLNRGGRRMTWTADARARLATQVAQIREAALSDPAQVGRRTQRGACKHLARTSDDPLFRTPPGGKEERHVRNLEKRVSQSAASPKHHDRPSTDGPESRFPPGFYDLIKEVFEKP